ncbi:unnamed protein product (macronuclear) [Paramecium tetraurelia]|uniref:Aurora kinase n=1 Tax=Paramecium tetraurelia TaxID=5888 RepID=A0E0Z2_PARTE|nr:uncharacterized protein GSPATT00022128001 [Paramecium tetraurelia]CAK88959.1 unnamed protein product [Paramecium tetraurelia]|eukprot:XP_001456356.1 hypothetical protein (macronuclear) [Paramecium tetraurelia strain d4-2]
MNQVCSYKYCTNKTVLELEYICSVCQIMKYCSQKCRDTDWTLSHKNNCRPCQIKSKTELNDSASTLKSIRRSAEDFEIIIKDNKMELGKGSYGCVKLVKDRQNGQMYAMKVMNKKQIFEYCSVENLKREIKIQRKLQHPHITKLFHYFEDKENVFLILELAENGSLFSYIRKRRRLPENEAFVYYFQTCLGIDYLHKKNIIHRDLKPENLLLDKSGNIKVCDFGWSAETTQNGVRRTFCGTLDYMAPEMLTNQPYSFSLDIWCLGILLYELIHGYAPFKGRTENEKCNNIVKMAPIEYDPTLSIEAKQLIQGILKFNPAERLSMNQIFDHVWMKKFYKSYGIDLRSYMYKEDKQNDLSSRSISPQNEDLMSRSFNKNTKQISSNGDIKNLSKSSNYVIPQNVNNNCKSTACSNYNQDDDFKTRVSRVSQRQQMAQGLREIQAPQQRQEEMGFMDKVFSAFGCLSRDKQQSQSHNY